MNEPKSFPKKSGEPSKSDSSGDAGDKKNPFPPASKDGEAKKSEGGEPKSKENEGGGDNPGDGSNPFKGSKPAIKGGSLFQKLIAGVDAMESGQPTGQPAEQPQPGQEQGQAQPMAQEGQEGQGGQSDPNQAAPAPAGNVDFRSIVDFFAQNPDPNDGAFHAFCEQNSYDTHAAESIAYSLATIAVKLLRGGRSGDPSFDINSVDPDELQMGIEIESEHVDDPSIQKKIALDHLAERPDYYSLLSQMEGGDQGGGQYDGGADMEGSLMGSNGRSGDGY